ncbi:tyrosine-type recombinase/integrase [Staphylococcus borealis]|nr:tyrosine-type recombinase/integrase [Staphylococcus borealis]MDM7862867.1 tyrosine-type recombinase/integrase [Staphylococcus borealis]
MDKLYNKDSTYHKLSGNSYNPNIIKSRTTKIKKNDDSIQNFKIQASRVDKGNGCLSQCLKDAVYNGHIKKDPTYNIATNGTVKAKDERYKYMSITHYLAMLNYFKNQDEQSYIFLYLLAITGARYSDLINMTYKDLNKSEGIIHLPGTKTKNIKRDVEVSTKDVLLINSNLSKLPRRIDGKLFKLSHNAKKIV